MEDQPTSEVPQISRDQVLEVLKKLSARGIAHQDELYEMVDPEVVEANRLVDLWTTQEQAAMKEVNPEAQLEFSFSRSTIFVDAGFTDPDYLDEVANDWLVQDLDAAEGYGLTDLVARIEAKIAEIRAKLA